MSTLQAFIGIAGTLEAQAIGRKPPARLFFLTDRDRPRSPLAVARRLPPGAAVIYRAFGAPDAEKTARRLRDITRRRKCLLLVGADEALAVACGADGLHLPERMLGEAVAMRARHPDWVLTGAAHSAEAVAAGAALDAVLVSPVFASRSASAGAPLGIERLAELVRLSEAPVIALGGVDAETAPRLLGSGVAGLAAVDGWAPTPAALALAWPYTAAWLRAAAVLVAILAVGSLLAGWVRGEPSGLFGANWAGWLVGPVLGPLVWLGFDFIAVVTDPRGPSGI